MRNLHTRAVRSAFIVVLVVGALALAACGSSESDTSSKKAAPTGPTAAKPSGSVLKIGVIGSLTGSQAASSNQGATVAPAWERYVNEQLGGINGHPVKVYLGDDRGDPASAQSVEKDLVDSKGVIALIVSSDNLVSAYSADAISKGVALISGSANSQDWYSKAGMFETPTDVLSGLSAQVAVAKQFAKAKKFVSVYCSEIAACGQANPPLKSAADKAGLGFTSLAVSSTAPNYTAECLKLKQGGSEFAQMNFESSAAARFVRDCQQQGYNPTFGSSAQAIGKELLAIPNLKLYGPAYAFPSVANAPAAKNFRDVMARFAKGSNWREGVASFTWDGLEVFRKATATIGPSPTPQDVVNGLNSIKGENLGGELANKLTYTAGKPVPFGGHPCYFVIGIKGGKTIAPANLDPQCVS